MYLSKLTNVFSQLQNYLSRSQTVFVQIEKYTCLNCKKSKLQNVFAVIVTYVFVQITKCIWLNCKMYLSKLQNVQYLSKLTNLFVHITFVQIEIVLLNCKCKVQNIVVKIAKYIRIILILI